MIELYKDRNLNPVSEVQFYLREISFHKPEIPLINPDGIYDEQTKKAVIEFQKIYDLPPTGIVDLATWNKLVKEYSNFKYISSSPNKIACFPSHCVEVKKGDECDIVYIIQILLNSLAKRYKNYNKIEINGKYDTETENAVKTFQAANKLPITGIVDKKTWNSLSSINDICKLYNN